MPANPDLAGEPDVPGPAVTADRPAPAGQRGPAAADRDRRLPEHPGRGEAAAAGARGGRGPGRGAAAEGEGAGPRRAGPARQAGRGRRRGTDRPLERPRRLGEPGLGLRPGPRRADLEGLRCGGDLGNILGFVSDFVPDPAGVAVGAISAGLGVAALEGHPTAEVAGADVAPETLIFDGLGAATSIVGVVPAPPGSAARDHLCGIRIVGGTSGPRTRRRSHGQEVRGADRGPQELLGAEGRRASSRDEALVGGVAAWNAMDAGVKADNAPERRRERAEEEVWN